MSVMERFHSVPSTEIQHILEQALKRLTIRDASLLVDEANERTLACRLAIYLQSALPQWDVDCEYNCWQTPIQRKGHMVIPTTSDATVARTIYPDILIHHRDSSEPLAVIELGKSSYPQSRHQDLRKLRGCHERLGCHYAIWLELGVGEACGDYRIEVLQ